MKGLNFIVLFHHSISVCIAIRSFDDRVRSSSYVIRHTPYVIRRHYPFYSIYYKLLKHISLLFFFFSIFRLFSFLFLSCDPYPRINILNLVSIFMIVSHPLNSYIALLRCWPMRHSESVYIYIMCVRYNRVQTLIIYKYLWACYYPPFEEKLMNVHLWLNRH